MNETALNTPALPATLIAVMLGVAMLGCGSPDEPDVLPSMGVQAECLDLDEDGYGHNCAQGPDCDDNDADITGACDREIVRCHEGKVRDCSVKLPTHGDTANCLVGVEVCVDGAWTECGQGGEV